MKYFIFAIILCISNGCAHTGGSKAPPVVSNSRVRPILKPKSFSEFGGWKYVGIVVIEGKGKNRNVFVTDGKPDGARIQIVNLDLKHFEPHEGRQVTLSSWRQEDTLAPYSVRFSKKKTDN